MRPRDRAVPGAVVAVIALSLSLATVSAYADLTSGLIAYLWIDSRALAPAEGQEFAAQITGAGDEPVVVGTIDLRVGAHPASGQVRIVFTLAQAAEARVEVCDLGGRLIRVLADGVRSAGEHLLTWDGRGGTGVPAPAGMYFVSARSEGWGVMKRLILIR
jgi:hypothetical protein